MYNTLEKLFLVKNNNNAIQFDKENQWHLNYSQIRL